MKFYHVDQIHVNIFFRILISIISYILYQFLCKFYFILIVIKNFISKRERMRILIWLESCNKLH